MPALVSVEKVSAVSTTECPVGTADVALAKLDGGIPGIGSMPGVALVTKPSSEVATAPRSLATKADAVTVTKASTARKVRPVQTALATISTAATAASNNNGDGLEDPASSSEDGLSNEEGARSANTSRRLSESVLYQENVFEFGHASVWGSWFDSQAGRWGYACCRGLERRGECNLGVARPMHDARGIVCRRPTAAQHDTIVAAAGAAGVQPRSSFVDPVRFVIHWIAAMLMEWRESLRTGRPEVLAHPRFGTEELLAEAERTMTPLLSALEACAPSFSRGEPVHIWSDSYRKWVKDGNVLEVLSDETVMSGGSADGRALPAGSVFVAFGANEARKWIRPDQVGHLLRKARSTELSKDTLEKLEKISALAAEREYQAANEVYVELTVGHGKWHGDLSVKGMTGCAKAPRNGFMVKKDVAGFLDSEAAKDYMFCLKRLVALAQLIRPNTDLSKHAQC